jgi:N6-L-threonylcarbamoyladenine synthase
MLFERHHGQQTGLILGIESSCDETTAAIVRLGTEALSNVVASQNWKGLRCLKT